MTVHCDLESVQMPEDQAVLLFNPARTVINVANQLERHRLPFGMDR